MISYREEFFNQFIKEKVFTSSSFKTLKNCLKDLTLYGPYQTKEEQGFVKEAKQILDIITSIFRKPKISNKDEDFIVRSEQASYIDSTSFRETLNDSSLWKRKNGVMTPEHVHVKQVTDTYNLYENSIITRVLDFINDELSNISRIYEKRILNCQSFFESQSFGYGKYGFFEKLNQESFPYRNILYQKEMENEFDHEVVNKLLKKCSNLFATEFYKEVSKFKAKRNEIYLTNILLKDRRYYSCYKFYKKYISSRDESYFLPIYQDYVLLRMLHDLSSEYSIDARSNQMNISYQNGLVFDKDITISDKYFTYQIAKDLNQGFILKTYLKKDKSITSSYYLLLTLDLNQNNYPKIKEQMDLIREQGYDDVILITLRNNTNIYDHILSLSFYEIDNSENAIKNLFTNFHLLFDTDISVYSHICPVCGKRISQRKENMYYCFSCDSLWTNISINNKDYLYIKRLKGK